MKSKCIIGILALSCVSTQAQAMRSGINTLCVSFDAAAQSLSLEARTGCLRTGTRLDSDSLAMSVDQPQALIQLTGEYKTSYPNRIGPADCMGSRTLEFTAAEVEPRRYSVMLGERFIGTADLTADAGARYCFSSDRFADTYLRETDFKDWAVGGAEGWQEWRAGDLQSLFAPLMASVPEGMEGRPEVELSLRKEQWLAQNVPMPAALRSQATDVMVVRLKSVGLLDDSVSGQRFTGIARLGEDGWSFLRLYSQSMCARGGTAGQWSADGCL